MIYPDPKIMNDNASQIRNIAERISHLNNVNLTNAANSIAAVWKGDAANRYLSHCATTREEIAKLVRELHAEADDNERAARELGELIKQMEQAAGKQL